MRSTLNITRRLVLRKIGLGAVALGGLSVGAVAKPGHASASVPSELGPEVKLAVDLVRTTVPHYRNAARLGAAYLRTAPKESDLPHLLSALMTDSEVSPVAEKPEEVRSAVRRQIATDFEHGSLVEVEGWVMSLTEVRIAALAHVVRDVASKVP